MLARQRDLALERVRNARRGLIVLSTALSAAIAAILSSIAPGRSLGAVHHLAQAATVRGQPQPASHQLKLPPLASPSDLGLSAPAQAPQSGPAAPSPSSSSNVPAPSAAVPAQPAPQVQSGPAPAVSGGS